MEHGRGAGSEGQSAVTLTGMSAAALRIAGRALLDANRISGVAPELGLRYDFVCPSRSHYPFQWFWDSCFHAVVLARFDLARAEGEIRCLLQAARPDGFVPHILFWNRPALQRAVAAYNLPRIDGWTSDTPQPPVLGTALLRLRQAGASRVFLSETAHATLRLYDWWGRERDPDGDGLISILQPDESGLDASPKYDQPLGLAEPSEAGLRAAMDRLFAAYAPMRGDQARMAALRVFDVEDVMVNAIYAQGRRDLAAVLDVLGVHATATRCRAAAARTEAALLKQCWDEDAGAFWDIWRTPDGDRQIKVRTVTSLLPLILAVLPPRIAARLAGQLDDPDLFSAPFGCPSVARTEAAFAAGAGIIWRGPTWINSNWLLVHGLRRHGFAARADALARASRALIARAGFREYFNPDTGEGYGATGFGWSTLALDM
jgi:hypothetical protein